MSERLKNIREKTIAGALALPLVLGAAKGAEAKSPTSDLVTPAAKSGETHQIGAKGVLFELSPKQLDQFLGGNGSTMDIIEIASGEITGKSRKDWNSNFNPGTPRGDIRGKGNPGGKK